LDFEEIDHKNGIYPAPNDKYKYFETEIWAAPKRNLETQEQAKIGANENWTQESISLKNLQYRNKENDKNFDKLICHAINSGLKENKMMFLHPSDTGGRNSFITPDIIKDKEMAGDIRFISSEILEELALNPKYNRTYSVEIYDDQRQEFYMVPLGELGKLIDGIEKSKSISPSTTP
jgi:hypothetical protein